MIFIEAKLKDPETGNQHTILIDVVNQKMRRIEFNGQPPEESRWWQYKELQGQGKPGETLKIVWLDNLTTDSYPIESLKFTK